MDISVIIPTHNRPENLLKTLKSLHVSIKSAIKVLILIEPNSNSLPNKNELDILSDKLKFEYIENKLNVGGDESIIRAHEYVNSEWIYFMGDSKPIKEDAIQIISKTIETFPNSKAHHFSYDSNLSYTRIISSIKELTKSGLTLGDFILGGNYILSRDIISKYIKYSYRVLTSRIANSAMSLMALDSNYSITISSERIIDRFIEKPSTYNPGDDLANCWASFSILCMLPIKHKDAKYLNKYIINYYSISDRITFFKYIILKLHRNKQRNVSKLVKNILSTRYIFYCDYTEKISILFLYILVIGYEKIIRR